MLIKIITWNWSVYNSILCFNKPLEKKKRKRYRIVLYDFEVAQDDETNDKFKHIVNFITAKVVYFKKFLF